MSKYSAVLVAGFRMAKLLEELAPNIYAQGAEIMQEEAIKSCQQWYTAIQEYSVELAENASLEEDIEEKITRVMGFNESGAWHL